MAHARPNIVFITTDQQSATMLSCAGNQWLSTPAMDRIGDGGCRFERAYCTNPVCMPSRFSWYAGRMPSELGIRDNKAHGVEQVPEAILATTAGRLLSDAGYRVAYGGKTHLPGDMTPEAMASEFITDDKRDDLAEVSAAWIRARATQGDGPFFLSANFVNPHDICFMSMREYIRQVRADDPDLNTNERWLLSDDSVEMGALAAAMALPEGVERDRFFAELCPPLPANHQPQADEPDAVRGEAEGKGFRRYARERWSDETWRLHRWAYHRLTEQVDRQVGTILDALDEAGLAEDTLVIFTSDHGDHDGAHKLDQKVVPYEEAARIPLLLRWPGRIPAGRIAAAGAVSNGLDLIPTLCEAAGVVKPDALRGRSLLPEATGASAGDPERAVPIESHLGNGVVIGRVKYLRYDAGEGAEQLYDLASDPGETRNHLGDPALADELTRCRAAYVELAAAAS